MWSSHATPANESTEQTVDWLMQNRYTIKNKKGEPTFYSHAHSSWSTIDLTFLNPMATTLDVTRNWTVDRLKAFGSDHFALRWDLDYGTKEIDNPTGKKFNFKAADPKEWKEAFQRATDKQREGLGIVLDLDADLTAEQLDNAAESLTLAMQEANNATVPLRKPSDKARPWWNVTLEAASRRIAEQRSLNLDHQRHWGAQSPSVSSLIKKSKQYFKRLYKKARSEWFTKTLEEAKTKDIWGFPKWGKGVRTYPSPAISRGPGREPAVQHVDKCDALRDELFQPPPPLQGVQEPDLTTEATTDFPHAQVTKEEVQNAIYDQGADKAPGISQNPFRGIRWAWEVTSDTIAALMHHCVKAGYHPKAWRKAIAVALPKPRKPDYTNPRAYRLIQLLECLGKVLERIVATRLAYLVTIHNLVPANQFGGRPSSSTDDTILTFVNDVKAAHNHGKVTSALTFDIKGFFDFVNHKRLLTVMREKGIPIQLVHWTASFLTDRQAAICLDGIRGEMKPVENGIPQGSPVSPILSIIYAAEILEIFQKKAENDERARIAGLKLTDKPTATNLIMFVDDGKLYVSSESLDTNVQILRRAYKVVEDWLESVGLSPDLVKRELMHYSKRRPKQGDSPSISLPDGKGGEVVVQAERTTKWLGVHLDRRLTFDFHIKQMAGRAEKTVNGMGMLANTVRGLSQTHLRSLYVACVRPIMTYACAAWWTGKQLHVDYLERVQRRALRLICAAFRTTPITALEIESAIAPIRHHLELTSNRAAIRFNKLTPFSPILHRLPEEWRILKVNAPPPPLPTHVKPTARRKTPTKTTRLCKLALRSDPQDERILPLCLPPWKKTIQDFKGRLKVTPATKGTSKEDAAYEHVIKIATFINSPQHLLVYSDGSMLEKRGNRRENRTRKKGGGIRCRTCRLVMGSKRRGGIHSQH
ncbi:hypothetical protein AcW1_010370 [Taiwanofungus camphoratus]|nr:hypothetical protein AcW1_010370 [Antrodia cinnamomea]